MQQFREKVTHAHFLLKLPHLCLRFSFSMSKYRPAFYKMNHHHPDLVPLKSAFFPSPAVLLMSLLQLMATHLIISFNYEIYINVGKCTKHKCTNKT